MEFIINGVRIHSLKEIDDSLAFHLEGQDISRFENPFADTPNETNTGIYSIFQCPHCMANHKIEKDLAYEGYIKNMRGYFLMECSNCTANPKKLWTCPNECEINHVLVCGGDIGSKDDSNIYFIMNLDGTYSNQLRDGTYGVPDECYDHADGGCCLEPICPECLTVCTSSIEGGGVKEWKGN